VIVFGMQEIASFVARVLTKKQLEVFYLINGPENFTFSKFVKKFSNAYPQSTLKHILKHLRSIGLVEFENGQPLQLTKLGSLIKEGVENET